MCKLKELAKKCFVGEVTLPKATLWLMGTACLFGGIAYGLKAAPMTHGVMIGSNNGNNCGNGHEQEKEEEKTNDTADAES